MKKLLVVVAAVLLTVPVFAENPTAQGNFMITLPLFDYTAGTGDLYKNSAGDKKSSWTIGTEQYELGAQWFVINNLAIGGGIFYTREKEGSTTTSKTFAIVPEVSYYMPFGDIIPFVSTQYFYTNEDLSDKTIKQWPIKIGAAYMVSKNLAPYASFSYNIIDKEKKQTGDPTVKGHGYRFEAGIKAFF